jgi:hypothetical protein
MRFKGSGNGIITVQRLVIQDKSARAIWGNGGRLGLRFALGGAAFLGILGLAAPYINAGAFRGAIQKSLEESLGRKVEIETVHFTLFHGPGFILGNVTIKEDAHYGLEPFAYIPTLGVRVRLDKLLLGQVRPLGLHMEDARLNLVKSDDGTWNAVALVERLGAPRSTPLSFFPAVQISNGRVDFKIGTRKTTLYIMDTDLSLYPQRSGKIYFRFEGSPARTDRRAGSGFGHLNGTANWYLQPASATANQLEADVNLQPSNLSELATLFQGQDLGVHGTVSAHVLISGPFSDLRALGNMRLEDVHRWDLLPSPGDSWRVAFRANVDLRTHRLDLSTLPLDSGESPVTLHLRANDFMTHPAWSALASLKKAPLASLLPLGRRMGIGLPAGLRMDGDLDGVIGCSSLHCFEGGVVITNAAADIPDVPPLRSASATVTISENKVHIDPAILQSNSGGTLRAGGDFNLANQNMRVDINADQFSAAAFQQTTNAWFGSPEALSLIKEGKLSGRFVVSNVPGKKPSWSGQMQFADATASIPGVAAPVRHLAGKATFDEDTFDLPRLSGMVGPSAFTGSYRYSIDGRRPEHLRLVFAAADLSEIETDLAPALNDDSLLSHLPFRRRTIPAWLANRSMEGQLSVARFSIHPTRMGSLSAHFIWQGTLLQLTNVELALPAGKLQGSGNVAMSARLPRYHLALKVDGYPWGGGVLAADGHLESSGTGSLALQNLQAAGAFSGEAVAVAGSDPFSALAGQFTFAFQGELALLKLTKVEARQNDEDWTGEGTTGPDGKLHLDLSNGDRQVHLVTDLIPVENEAHLPGGGLH